MLRVSEGQGTRLPKTRAAQRSTLTSVLQFLGKPTHMISVWAVKNSPQSDSFLLKNCQIKGTRAEMIQMVYRSQLMQLQCGVSSRVPSGSPRPSLPPHPGPADASPATPPLLSPAWPPRHAGKTQLPSPQQGWAGQALRYARTDTLFLKKTELN